MNIRTGFAKIAAVCNATFSHDNQNSHHGRGGTKISTISILSFAITRPARLSPLPRRRSQISKDDNYPATLGAELYPEGIPIFPEAELVDLIRKFSVDQVIFAYSDVGTRRSCTGHRSRWRQALIFASWGLKADDAQIEKTGRGDLRGANGGGQISMTCAVAEALKAMAKRLVVVRHPMPYGDLTRQAVQRFATMDDLTKENVTIEEREGYEPHIARGSIVLRGERITKRFCAGPKKKRISSCGMAAITTCPFFSPTFYLSWPTRTAPGMS